MSASASSVWDYTFTDSFCSSCSPISFSFQQDTPLSIMSGDIFQLPGDQLLSCNVQNVNMYCAGISMYWLSDGEIQINFFREPLDGSWELPDEATFRIPGLDVQATWTNAFSVDPFGIQTQTFSIVDPESAETPEPSSGLLMIPVLAFFVVVRKRQFA
jgi:hypothetical protein